MSGSGSETRQEWKSIFRIDKGLIYGKKQVCQRVSQTDEYGTPEYALHPIIPLLKPNARVWECAYGKGILASNLRKHGFSVYPDPEKGERPEDFLRIPIEEALVIASKVDYIITNPPYSTKTKFLERCYGLKKPFALLMPITALEGESRQRLYREHGIQLIIPNKRVNYITPDGKGNGSWFASAWFTHGLGLERELNFYVADW